MIIRTGKQSSGAYYSRGWLLVGVQFNEVIALAHGSTKHSARAQIYMYLVPASIVGRCPQGGL